MHNEIADLKNQVRTLKRVIQVFGFLLVAGVMLSATRMQAAPDVLQAKALEVVNGEGKAVAELGTDEYGNGVLRVRDYEGQEFASLFLNVEGNGGLLISNKLGHEASAIGVYDGSGVVSVYHDDRRVAARLGANLPGYDVLRIFNKDATILEGVRVVIGLSVDEDQNGVISTFNAKGDVTSRTP